MNLKQSSWLLFWCLLVALIFLAAFYPEVYSFLAVIREVDGLLELIIVTVVGFLLYLLAFIVTVGYFRFADVKDKVCYN